MTDPLRTFGLAVPLIQAPMAGVSAPVLAAAVSEAGALGSIALGASDVAGAGAMIADLRARTARPFNVNLFTHEPPVEDAAREAAWLRHLAPAFAEFDAQPPAALETIYPTFTRPDPAMLRLLVESRPAVISFHFGLPPADAIRALKEMGALLLASATSLAEGQAVARAGIDVVVAQGFEAGGHRGQFDPAAPDEQLGTLPLTRLLVREGGLPVVAAGGIMDGAGIAAVLALGAVAAQLGTAFIACPETAADAAYRSALLERPARRTVMTSAISGRPARALANRFTALGEALPPGRVPPDYPRAYAAGKALHRAATAAGESGYSAQWAGQGAALSRALPAAELVQVLAAELAATRRQPS